MKHPDQRLKTIVMAAILATAGIAKAAGVDLTGVIRDDRGKPLAGASILVSTAGVKTGYSVLCPSCYADCTKEALTGGDGRFVIADLSPDLRFSMAVVAPGYQPRMTRRLDPAKLSLLMHLTPLHLDQLDPREYVIGRVIDEAGQTVPHAVVETIHGDVEGEGGAIRDLFQEFVVTDDKGAFVLTSKKRLKMKEVTFRIKARGYAPHMEVHCNPGAPERVIRLNRGVTVSGVLMHGDRPVPNAQVGLVQKDRSYDRFLGEERVGTDAKGRFMFTNMSGGQEYFLYCTMDSVKQRGATQAIVIKLKEPGSHLDTGVLPLMDSLSLAGQVVLDDAGPIPPHTKIMLSREDAWDHQQVELDDTGRFSFQGLPPEAYSLSLHIPGYAISELNPSLDRYNPRSLIGRVDGDIRSLSIWMERQKAGRKADPAAHFRALKESGWKQEKVQEAPLRGFTPP